MKLSSDFSAISIARRLIFGLWGAALVVLAFLFPVFSAYADMTVEMVNPLTPELRAIAEAYFPNDPDNASVFKEYSRDEIFEEMDGVLVDVNDDGVPEAFFRTGERWGLCGTQGCDVYVLQKTPGGWRFIGDFYDRAGQFDIQVQKDKGFHRLTTYSEINSIPVDVIWTGERYSDGQ